jgi:hypothetical protein
VEICESTSQKKFSRTSFQYKISESEFLCIEHKATMSRAKFVVTEKMLSSSLQPTFKQGDLCVCVCVCVCVSLSLYVHCPPSSCSNLSHLFCKLEQTSSRSLKFNKPFEHKAHNIPILPLRNNVRGRSASTHSAPTHPPDPRLLPPTKHNCSKEREKKKIHFFNLCFSSFTGGEWSQQLPQPESATPFFFQLLF